MRLKIVEFETDRRLACLRSFLLGYSNLARFPHRVPGIDRLRSASDESSGLQSDFCLGIERQCWIACTPQTIDPPRVPFFGAEPVIVSNSSRLSPLLCRWLMLKPAVQTHDIGGILVAEFWDCLRLDPAPVLQLRTNYEAHLRKAGRPNLVVDLSGVGFAGSAALGNFVALHRIVRPNGGRIVFCNVDPTVAEVFRASQLESLFEFVADRDAAYRAWPSGPWEGQGISNPPVRARRQPTSRRRRFVRGSSACAVGAAIREPRLERAVGTVSSQGKPEDSLTRVSNYGASRGVETMPVAPRIQAQDADGVTLVRFQDHQLFDERVVREAAEQIAAALPNDGSPIRLVVNFSDVTLISSTLLSKLILLQRRVDASHGRLRLCEMSPVIQQVFRTSNLDRLFKIDRDRTSSLESFQ